MDDNLGFAVVPHKQPEFEGLYFITRNGRAWPGYTGIKASKLTKEKAEFLIKLLVKNRKEKTGNGTA
jgi:hypothetical protein